MSFTIAFGESARVRLQEGEGDVLVIHEQRTEDGEWCVESTLTIPERAVGDVCAALARSYDASLTRKMMNSRGV